MLVAQGETDVLLAFALDVCSGDSMFASKPFDVALEQAVVALSVVFEDVRHAGFFMALYSLFRESFRDRRLCVPS